jgi:hypothetical protein
MKARDEVRILFLLHDALELERKPVNRSKGHVALANYGNLTRELSPFCQSPRHPTDNFI